MTRLDLLCRLHAQRGWANQRVLDTLARQAAAGRPLDLFAHILCSEQAWLARLQHRSTAGMQIWPVMTVEECRTMMAANDAGFTAFLEQAAEAGLDTTVTYKNFKGVEFTTPIADILTHVATHGAYHRGQIAQALRQAGLEPIETDFIVFQRHTTNG